MTSNLFLSENLTLESVSENNWKDGKLIAVVCYFRFFGSQGEASIFIDELENDRPSYFSISIVKELSDNFKDLKELSDNFKNLLQKEENWKKIILEVKKYTKEWESLMILSDIFQKI
jgi:phosphatidylserine/phosphatidylglycerophosphate/cardiolipin synthase-like enzyme